MTKTHTLKSDTLSALNLANTHCGIVVMERMGLAGAQYERLGVCTIIDIAAKASCLRCVANAAKGK